LRRICAKFLDLTNGAIQDLFDFFPSFLPFGKTGGLQIQRCQGFAVENYGGTFGALTLKPYGFCNIGVYGVWVRHCITDSILIKIRLANRLKE
jgi:hypothetical protein